jgi:GNAT superfamily N-acetyltransferase
VVVARDGEKVVGVSTCLPMADEGENIAAPFIAAGHDISKIFYFGESVLLSDYRGQGIGVKFFAARERQAAGYEIATFCAVNRPADHPQRPAAYTPLDDFWTHRGYTKQPDLVCEMSWREVGQDHETRQQLTFWTKKLS